MTNNKQQTAVEWLWEIAYNRELTSEAWKQAKDYNYYLSFFTKFQMWDEVFPGANINTNLVESKDFVVVIANLFKNESTLGLTDKLAQEYKIELELATKVTFLISLVQTLIQPRLIYCEWIVPLDELVHLLT